MTRSNPPACAAAGARRAFLVQSGWSAVFAALMGPLVLTAIAMAIGTPDALLGYTAVLPSLAGALTLLTAPLAAGRLNPKAATIALIAASRALAAALAALPALGRTTNTVLLFFVLALGCLTLHAQATSTLSSWMLDFVAEAERGRYTSRRLAISLAVSAALSVAVGRFLDASGASDAAFVVVVALAAASALPELIVLCRTSHPSQLTTANRRRVPVRVVIQDPHFMALSGYVTVFYFFLLLSDSYTYPHLLGNLRLSATSITLFGLLGSLPQILLLPFWGRRCDRTGHHTVLRQSVWLFAAETFVWACAGRGWAIIWVPIGFLAAALANSAFTVAVFARRYQLMPAAHRVIYEAVFTTMTAVAYVGGPALGGVVRQLFEHLDFSIEFAPVRALYLLSTLTLLLLQLATRRRRAPRWRPSVRDVDAACLSSQGAEE